MQTILYEVTEPIARITLNRPEKRNAIGPQTVEEITRALNLARHDNACRVLIITGAGNIFSAGGDLSVMGSGKKPAVPLGWGNMLRTMHSVHKPVIAMVNGHAIAGGFGLVCASDLVVASESATFATPEVKVGMWPMIITSEIIRNIGRKKALELMLTGRRISATEAERIGLVNRVVPADALEAETLTLATELAAQSPSITALGLASFYAVADTPYDEAISFLEAELGKLMELPDSHEGLRAFIDKRKPRWSEPQGGAKE